MEGWEGNLGSEVNRAELVAPGTGRRQKTSRWIIQGSNAGEGSHLKVIQGMRSITHRARCPVGP